MIQLLLKQKEYLSFNQIHELDKLVTEYTPFGTGATKNKVTGQVEIINRDKNEATIKEYIVVIDYRRKDIIKFVGTRTFK